MLIMFIWGIDGSVRMQREVFYRTSRRTGPGSLSLTLSWTVCENWNWHFKVFFIFLPTWLFLFSTCFFFFSPHVEGFFFFVSKEVEHNVTCRRNPWPVTSLQSLLHVTAKSKYSLSSTQPTLKHNWQPEHKMRNNRPHCLLCSAVFVTVPVPALPALCQFSQGLLACKRAQLWEYNTPQGKMLFKKKKGSIISPSALKQCAFFSPPNQGWEMLTLPSIWVENPTFVHV